MSSPRKWLARAARKSGLLLLIALVPALLCAGFHPRRPSWHAFPKSIPEITFEEINHSRLTVLFIDARPLRSNDEPGIPGGLPLVEARWDEQLPAIIDAWTPETRLVVYCDTDHRSAGERIAIRLRRELALPGIYFLKGETNIWNQGTAR